MMLLCLFQSTRPVWGATLGLLRKAGIIVISIHAPRVGRDLRCGKTHTHIYISIHAPRVGRDDSIPGGKGYPPISIHAPRVGRDLSHRFQTVGRWISIHAPRVGRDQPVHSQFSPDFVFQSTRPVWGATCERRRYGGVYVVISIHAPRVGRDSKFDDFTPSNLHKRYKRVLARPKNTREKGKIKQKLAYIHAFSAFLGCEGSGTFCALVLRTQYR